MDVVKTEQAPKAIGPYSQAIITQAKKWVFVSGQIPIHPHTGEVVQGDIKVQTRQVLENLKAILLASGSGLECVVKTTVFLKDMNDFPLMNEVYATFFPSSPPARSTVEVSRLPRDVRIEIECIAEIPDLPFHG